MRILMVPVRVDALVLETDLKVTETSADFSRLPYFDGIQDINPRKPYISETVLGKPFQNTNLNLERGVHLHWSLPDALTHGSQSGNDIEFPTVPNRWLVTRLRGETPGNRTVEKQWVVQSDYLHPEGSRPQSDAITIPYEPRADEFQPFRYMGRVLPGGPEASTGASRDRYLERLTAVGYGDPQFAAFYPNCYSVFGFRDELPENIGEVVYQVIGWYGNGKSDRLKNLLAKLEEPDKFSTEKILKHLEDFLQWKTIQINPNSEPKSPEEMLCYARIGFKPKTSTDTPNLNSEIKIAVGNTGSETLAAYMGRLLGGNESQGLIEDQLEALRISAFLRDKRLDTNAILKEARHERNFLPSGNQIIWKVQEESEGNLEKKISETRTLLPAEIYLILNRLNSLQREYERALREIESMREQTFADWYKYMLAAYPPVNTNEDYPPSDDIKEFIRSNNIRPLREKIQTTGVVSLEISENNQRVISASWEDPIQENSNRNSLANQLAQEINKILIALREFNQTQLLKESPLRFVLIPVAGPRFWRPNEPVILLNGESVKSSERHGQDGRLNNESLLECELLETPEKFNTIQELAASGNFDLVSKAIDQVKIQKNKTAREHHGFNIWRQQPWNPLMIEWRAEIQSLKNKGNLDSVSNNYSGDFITDNYELRENEPELSLRSGKGELIKSAESIVGRCILTPGAVKQFEERLETYLLEQDRASSVAELREKIDNLVNEENPKTFGNNPVYTALKVYQELRKGNFLAQTLDGFHEALLMRKKTAQLVPAEPIAFDNSFTENEVRQAVHNSVLTAPAALNSFNPIRSGALKLTGLRILDSFGRFLDLTEDQIFLFKATSLSSPTHPELVWLPPRLCQPARLNFRFLSARETTNEMNSLIESNPICGWLLPNNLDNSLLIYDDGGSLLGYINRALEWRSAPGEITPIEVENIENIHLRRMLQYLLARDANYFEDFLSTLNKALQNIDPENFAQNQSMAILLGRPIALLRASLNIELESLPALHQGWPALRQALLQEILDTEHRDKDEFNRVKFPIRLGEFKQFNDGLVGYWKESPDGTYQDNIFYAPQSDIFEDQDLIRSRGEGHSLGQSLVDEPQIVAILADPRGILHATTGVLPAKSISLPPEQYTAALEKIAAVFLRAPVITPAQRMTIPLPAEEANYTWSWLEKDLSRWREFSSEGVLEKDIIAERFFNGLAIWDELISKGWIRLRENDSAKADIIPSDRRTEKTLGEFYESQTPEIEALLAESFIDQSRSSAEFPGPIEIREGWLKLTPKK